MTSVLKNDILPLRLSGTSTRGPVLVCVTLSASSLFLLGPSDRSSLGFLAHLLAHKTIRTLLLTFHILLQTPLKSPHLLHVCVPHLC